MLAFTIIPDEKKIRVVGAVYKLNSGRIELLERP
jgi:hypothetical protein